MDKAAKYQVVFIDGASRVQFWSGSFILRADEYHHNSTAHIISAAEAEVYCNPQARDTIRVGNGGLGPTGLLQTLCQAHLTSKNKQLPGHSSLDSQSSQLPSTRLDVKVEWVANHSRHTQVALQAGEVDVALTYEREEEETTELEGWSKRVGVHCHDHFVIAGPKSDLAGLKKLMGSGGYPKSLSRPLPKTAFRNIASTESLFHTRGDGSTTMHREFAIWSAAGVSPKNESWFHRIPEPPLEALRRGDEEGAYLLIDRATYLIALNCNELRDIKVFVEGGEELLNTCSILVRSDEKREMVIDFAKWLADLEAQTIVGQYGKDWKAGLPLVTPVSQVEIVPEGNASLASHPEK